MLSIMSISGEAVHSSLAVAIRRRGLSTDHGICARMPLTCSTAVSFFGQRCHVQEEPGERQQCLINFTSEDASSHIIIIKITPVYAIVRRRLLY